jgi:pimeloyl-ACP methyl ester carboxylesterase
MEQATPEGIGRQAEAIAGWAGVCERLSTVAAPTLIVQGMADVITPPANAQMLADGIPGSWLVRLAGGGHGLQYQMPKHLARIVRAFLAK